MKKFTIVEVTPWFVRLADADGKELQVGYKKNAIKFLELKAKNMGDNIELNVQVSAPEYGSRYFLAENDEYQLAMLRAKEFAVKSRAIDAALAGA